MKKVLLTLLVAVAFSANMSAQNWNMVITKTDGTQVVIPATNVQNVTFAEATLEDKNVDQIIIKELYNGGCPKDEGSGAFQMDKGFVLYNNCP